MPISISEIRHIAELARLRLDPEEEQLYAQQLGRIVEYIDHLQSYSKSPARADGQAVERQDEAAPGLAIEEFLANAPESLDRFLLVPQVKADS